MNRCDFGFPKWSKWEQEKRSFNFVDLETGNPKQSYFERVQVRKCELCGFQQEVK